jgi:hypothetical protein
MCPVCSVSVAVSLGLSRWLGVDDSITGVWTGAMILVLSFWTIKWIFKKRDKKPMILLPVMIVLYWLLTFLPLYAMHIVSNTDCLTLFGLNRLVFGSLLGIVLSVFAVLIDKFSRKLHGGQRLFPYQKVIIPIGILLIASFILNSTCS